MIISSKSENVGYLEMSIMGAVSAVPNARIKHITKIGNRVRVTFAVEDSRGKYSRMNPISGRRISALCWHGHGEVFKAIWDRVEDAVIRTNAPVGNSGGIVYTKGDMFRDWMAGSMMYPWYMSEGCDCETH